MAARYAVATGNWDSTSIWSTTDGGGSGASVPTSADDVYFTLLSGVITVTMNVAISCRSINCTGFIGTLNSSGSLSHNIGDGTAGAGNVALKLVSGMTTGITSATVTINFISTSATQQTIESAGKTLSNITFNGAGSSYILSDALTLFGNCNLTVTQGTFNSNGYTITATGFNSSNANTRTLTFGSSSILLSGTTATTP